MDKLNYEEIKERLNKFGYHILTPEEEYINTQQNICCEKDGLKSWCSVVDITHKQGKSTSKRFFSLFNPFWKENMEMFIKKKDPNAEILGIEIITKSKHKRVLITMRCKCGTVFSKTWDNLQTLTYVSECNKCAIKNRGKSHRKDKQEALKLFRAKGYKILNEPEFFLRDEYLEVEDEDGYRGFISYNRLKSGRQIAILDVRTNKKYYIYNANLYAQTRGIKSEVIDFCDDKKWTRQGIKCRCQCGDIFTTSVSSFFNGKTTCDKCAKSSSRYERIVKQFLDDNSVRYIYQYRINSCKDVIPLPFDFWVEKNQGLIEVDGEGHFKPCNFNQISNEDAQKSFEATQKHDAIKNEYCRQWNIPLLRISYKDIQDGTYKEKIIQFIGD